MRVERNFDLSGRNTFGMKVVCGTYVEYSSSTELSGLDFDSFPKPWLHIGAGSNLLFEGDFHGTVFHSDIKYIKYVDMGLDEVPVAVGAGVVFDDFVADVCRNGLWGAENLSLIPGEVGAAAVQNIGAYGVEVKDIISGVVCYDTLEHRKVTFKTSECDYSYRHSMFKDPSSKGRYIVTSVLFRVSRKYSPKLEYKGILSALEGQTPQTPQQVRDAVIGIRREKLPDPAVTGSAGSFFKNPVIGREQFSRILEIAKKDGVEEVPHFDLPGAQVKLPAAWMIEQCGFKGFRLGNAAVYEKQPLVIVNFTGEASPKEIIELENMITGAVRDKYGIVLSPEVEHVKSE